MDYKPSKTGLLGQRAVVEVGNREANPTLVGQHGAIWPYNDDGLYFVLVTGPRVCAKYCGVSLAGGDEHGFVCDEATAKVWVDRLKVPKGRPKQCRLMDKIQKGA